MEVSCRSPGSNSWAPFRPNSSQPRRKTDRLSWRRQQQPVSSSLEQGWFTEISVALESVSLPARRWGWAACWSSWRVLVWSHLGACVEEEERPRFIESYGSLCMLVMFETSKSDMKWGHRLTRITGCRSPTHCGSPCLQSSSRLQPVEEGQENTDVKVVDGDTESAALCIKWVNISLKYHRINKTPVDSSVWSVKTGQNSSTCSIYNII